MNITLLNVRDLIKHNNEEIAKAYISTFSCNKVRSDGTCDSLNPDIENFLKTNALQFARMKTAITYLVVDIDEQALLGYFTVTHKSLTIDANGLTRRAKDKIKRFSTLDEESNTYTVSAFLIAQFGKNYGIDNGERITGKQLMDITKDFLVMQQDQIGGTIAYLDCENNGELIRFYESEGFSLFGERISEKDGRRYLQYLIYL